MTNGRRAKQRFTLRTFPAARIRPSNIRPSGSLPLVLPAPTMILGVRSSRVAPPNPTASRHDPRRAGLVPCPGPGDNSRLVWRPGRGVVTAAVPQTTSCGCSACFCCTQPRLGVSADNWASTIAASRQRNFRGRRIRGIETSASRAGLQESPAAISPHHWNASRRTSNGVSE